MDAFVTRIPNASSMGKRPLDADPTIRNTKAKKAKTNSGASNKGKSVLSALRLRGPTSHEKYSAIAIDGAVGFDQSVSNTDHGMASNGNGAASGSGTNGGTSTGDNKHLGIQDASGDQALKPGNGLTDDNEAFSLIWANKRQPLCDALPWFKSHEGGIYTNNKRVRGMLLDGSARGRDVIGAETIVTYIGGSRCRDGNGGMMYYRDQEDNSRYAEAFRRNIEEGIPVYIVLGAKHPYFSMHPGALPQYKYTPEHGTPEQYHSKISDRPARNRFYVLGWFFVTDLRREKYRINTSHEYKMVFTVRFQKANPNAFSWWYPESQPGGRDRTGFARDFDGGNLLSAGTGSFHMCTTCGDISPRIYEQGLTCMSPECVDFMDLHHMEPGTTLDNLRYSADYLMERFPYNGQALMRVRPQLPLTTYPVEDGIYGTETEFRRGMVCAACGCCSDRVHWNRWQCANANCKARLYPQIQPYPIVSVWAEWDELMRSNGRLSINKRFPVVGDSLFQLGQYSFASGLVATTWLFPGLNGKIIGSVTIMRSTKSINEHWDGPDHIWEDIDARAAAHDDHPTLGGVHLERNPVRCVGTPGEVRTRHFQQNYGAPYKFIVAVKSIPFMEAPDSILMGRQRMLWAGRTIASRFEQQVHDSGKELHPEARNMVFRDFNELLLVGYMEKDRISYHDDGETQLGPTVATLSLGSPSVMHFQTKKNPWGQAREVLHFPIRHGDMVIMHGTKLQQLYLHKVDPAGKRRFAMTCRYINPNKLKGNGEMEAIKKGELLGSRSHDFIYDGDARLTPGTSSGSDSDASSE